MRRMEQAADALYKQKMIRGFCHLAIGQEAVSVGMESAINSEDKVITSYRCHTFAVLRGGTIKGVIAELMGEWAFTYTSVERFLCCSALICRPPGRYVER